MFRLRLNPVLDVTVVGLTLLASMSLSSSLAAAGKLPTEYVRRPLTLPEDKVRFDGGPRWPDYDAQLKHVASPGAQTFLNPGLSFGATDNLELGCVAPLRVAPSLRLENPRLYTLYRLSPGSPSYGVFVELEIGVQGSSALTGGVPLLLGLSQDVRLDLAFLSQLEFAGNGTQMHLYFPAYLPIQISPRFFAGPEAALNLRGLGRSGVGVDISAGGFVGYTAGDVVDLFARSRVLDITSGFSAVEFMAGVELYFDM